MIPADLDDAIEVAVERAAHLADGDSRAERRLVGVLHTALLRTADLTRADVAARLTGRDRLAERYRPDAPLDDDLDPAPF
jgi:hypothetical protein